MYEEYEVGKCYFIRSVTFYYTGRLVRTTTTALVLEDAAWIADTGRFSQAMETGEFDQVEPYPSGWQVFVPFKMINDACEWPHPLPLEAK